MVKQIVINKSNNREKQNKQRLFSQDIIYKDSPD